VRTNQGALALFFFGTLGTAIPNRFRGVKAKFSSFLLALKLERLIGFDSDHGNGLDLSCAMVTNQMARPRSLGLFSHSKTEII
jgi:hypothetical protein